MQDTDFYTVKMGTKFEEFCEVRSFINNFQHADVLICSSYPFTPVA